MAARTLEKAAIDRASGGLAAVYLKRGPSVLSNFSSSVDGNYPFRFGPVGFTATIFIDFRKDYRAPPQRFRFWDASEFLRSKIRSLKN